ncbi:chaperone TorD involved in molybdoenzyme TorA maturation [Halogranum amylolyticum]|uniref:Chaperone TorD involved in molybdoenzyme TorA maturation n=1 Tax=Halogranum amylolyticum TaxID=660520 RepID=A0A1H8RNF4_9EURY|nr:molecular chaperone TorD family protein [Halogranum amylolyticum]SEO67886.1 chaperone TorD involved in molybdoenzyme TorA maturation [Halogranum amylolyticum]
MDDSAVYDARTELVDFVVEVFWDVPDRAFVDRLLSDEVAVPDQRVNDALDEGFDALGEFVETNRGRDLDDVHEELEVEYTRVFVGPRPPVLPHESYYREDTDYLGQGLADVEASYAAAGWKPPEDYAEENDFVAVELAFLRWIIGRQATGAEEAFGYERVFLDEHLTTWVDDFVDDVLAETDHDLFRAAALVLRGLVEFEDELVAQMAR